MTFLFKVVLSMYDRASRQERKVIRLVLELTRRFLIWLGDPLYSMEIRGKRLVLPVSHKLPIFVIDFPLYDTLPTRIADYLRARDHTLLMVDVGANIGDTILACSKGARADRFLGVEANPEFVSYLKKNTSNLEGFLLVEAFCYSGEEKQTYVRIESAGGTARVLEDKNGFAITKKTLDEILAEYPQFESFNFLKLDTDGSDFDILKGAQKSIGVSLPVILMECDVFGNVNYVDDVLSAIVSLAKAGYSTVIAYDNFGNYFCTFPADNPSSFLDAMAYQIVSEFGYFDLLFLGEKDMAFVEGEKEFFSLYARQKGLSTTLRKAFCL